ncbi:MAG: putative zinc-binding metallopeptidase [Prevotella sp.]|nr:putative zinc-binding metallopeptidase [Prevotella sp.]
MKKINYMLLIATVLALLSSCSEDKLSGDTIFSEASPQRDAFDEWLLKNYTYPYNVDFKYRMEDIESDMKYTLVPADSAKSAKLAIIVKYLWFDAYSEVINAEFVKLNVPRTIHLIGSPAYNSEGTMVLGTAEGGLKVTLYMVNWLTEDMLRDYATMNEYYFHTLHHEFTHILNQKKPYDTSFDLITESGYVSGDWYMKTDNEAHTAGFVTPYAMSEPVEDYAEMMSVYVTSTPQEWNAIIADAGVEGARLINNKLEMVRSYMNEQWNLDMDDLRDAVIRRAGELDKLDLETLN